MINLSNISGIRLVILVIQRYRRTKTNCRSKRQKISNIYQTIMSIIQEYVNDHWSQQFSTFSNITNFSKPVI